MTKPLLNLMAFHLAAFLSVLAVASAVAGNDWPQFRGPAGDGHADALDLPLRWSEGENIAWKVPVHDEGWSSPVILGKQLWLTTARADGHELFAVCFDVDTGKLIHDIKVFEVEKPARINVANSYASPTPIVEEGRVFVNFGTYGTACIDTVTGKVIWTRLDINCDHSMGPGSSLAHVGNLIVSSMDGMDQQYVIALDKATGSTVWKTVRSIDFSAIRVDWRKAFSTPAIVEVDGHAQVVSVGANGAMGYDALTGRELWKVRYVGWSSASRPVCGNGMAFVLNDYEKPQLLAIRLDGRGDVTDTHVAWKVTRQMPSTPSPLLVDGLIYVVNDQGLLVSIDAKTGKVKGEQKIGGIFGASPLYAAGRIYLFNRGGSGTVVESGRDLKILSSNKLDGVFMASPAVAENSIFLRSKTDLYRIGKISK